MKFSILHPTRGRPNLAADVLLHTIANANTNDFEYLMMVDADDPSFKDYMALPRLPGFKMLVTDMKDVAWVAKQNLLAAASSGDILVCIADDFFLPIDWDSRLESEIPVGIDQFVIWIDDGDDRITYREKYPNGYMTHPIVSRAYYLKKGHLFYPDYKHYWCDLDFYKQVLVDQIKVVFAKERIHCVHKHYQNPGGNQKDATYARAEAWGARDGEVFKRRWNGEI